MGTLEIFGKIGSRKLENRAGSVANFVPLGGISMSIRVGILGYGNLGRGVEVRSARIRIWN